MSEFRFCASAIVALCAIGCATAVNAQSAGTYSGTAADGSTISFTVAKDSSNKLAVTGASVSFTAPCKGTTPTSYSGAWSFGVDAEIKKDKASFVFSKNGGYYFYLPMTFNFATSPVTGTESIRIAILDTTTTKPPAKSEYCASAKQAYTATLDATAPARPALPPGAVMALPAQP
jgi:hypothetical protein